jgi:predicted TIM-barrel fold metal-dependent hydrolase
MEELGLSLDIWQSGSAERDYESIPRVTALARRYPSTTVVLNHLGCPSQGP